MKLLRYTDEQCHDAYSFDGESRGRNATECWRERERDPVDRLSAPINRTTDRVFCGSRCMALREMKAGDSISRRRGIRRYGW